ncbi:cell division protein FtsA [Fictibacillus halophilus]|uniref:cell division protein FtsA n=1 Tax=Fictibacillus halophilus TaxID=1610490 RepID=UPI001CFAB500|nr:cell division protein FtsA [Fictibacillus halophilus]
MDKNLLFALDIGTRSVVGMILKQHADGKYEVMHMKVMEHEERSMLDGQIHHIPAVAKVIKKIKEELELETGPLQKVCVAAAGRALKTVKGRSEKDISAVSVTLQEEVIHLELAAVQHAQFQLASMLDEKSNHIYDCVGYSVLHYYLDDQEIGSFIGQQGLTASVEVIATFLPRVVVESLIRALREAGLEMEALTLEPIAAINVLIPQSMRKLNVALVDIGAGTSDIALTAEGTVVAYGMVPVAGDEITEAISSEFLLDFPVAEEMKRSLYKNDFVEYTDILGFSSKKSKLEVLEKIQPAIENLAEKITKEILHLNAKPPQAVMLVGGGSMTPGLREKIAEKLDLPTERAAIRGIDAITSLTSSIEQTGPEFVTPVGIGIAARENPVKYVTVTVNDKTIRLFEVKKLTIGDALIAGGADLSKLYGRPGMGLMIKVNGEVKIIKGSLGTPPQIIMSGKEASLSDEIFDGAFISYIAGVNGANASIAAKEAVKEHVVKTILIDGEPTIIETQYYVNQQPVSPETLLNDRDELISYFPDTIEEVMEIHGLYRKEDTPTFSVKVDGKPVQLIRNKNNNIYLNGRDIDRASNWDDGDHLTFEAAGDKQVTLNELLDVLQLNLLQSCSVTFNNEEVSLTKPLFKFYRNGESLMEDSILFLNDELNMERTKQQPFIFQDIFTRVDIAISPRPGETLIILKNKEKAGFQTEIETGDSLELKFEVLI